MRKASFLSFGLALLMALILLGPSSAQEIYVKNRPFEGQTLGQGNDLELSLPALAEALGLESKLENGAWTLGDATVTAHEVDGHIFVHISALKDAGFKVTVNRELGTVDIRESKETAKSGEVPKKGGADSAGWGKTDGPTLVYFGASW